jgi:hypothetical protein
MFSSENPPQKATNYYPRSQMKYKEQQIVISVSHESIKHICSFLGKLSHSIGHQLSGSAE